MCIGRCAALSLPTGISTFVERGEFIDRASESATRTVRGIGRANAFLYTRYVLHVSDTSMKASKNPHTVSLDTLTGAGRLSMLVRLLGAGLLGLACTTTFAGAYTLRLSVPGLTAPPASATASPGLAVSTGTLAFGPTAYGSAATSQAVIVRNPGNAPLTVTSVSATNPDYGVNNACATVAPGGNCTVTVGFRPSVVGADPASLTVVTNAGTQALGLTGIGTGASFAFTPGSLNFPTLLVGTSQTATVTVTNSGNVAGTPSLSASAGYASSACGTGGALAAASSCQATITFSPTARQAYGGVLQVSGGYNGTQAIAVSGIGGAASFAVSTASLSFPSTGTGTTSTASVTVKNNGTIAAAPVFSTSTNFSASACGSLAPGASCATTLTFAPSASQAYSGTFQVSGAASSIQTVSLTADGRISAVATGGYSDRASAGAVLYSPDRTWTLDMQGDCNLVTYHNGVAQWNSQTATGQSACVLAVQNDGNLVVYLGSAVVWQSGTGGHAAQPTFLQMGNDGVVHMYAGQIGNPTSQFWQN